MDKLLLLIPTLSCTIFDFYRVMRPQGRITRFLFYFAEAGRPASWFAGQTMKNLTDMADTVDAGGSRPPPSSSRSGDPTVRGWAVRCRYLGGTIQGILRSLTLPLNDVQIFEHLCHYIGGTNRGIPARSARMTAAFENACRYHGGAILGILRLLAQALNDSRIWGDSLVACAPSE